jgi:glutamate--cysteine ligase catalytic subunit
MAPLHLVGRPLTYDELKPHMREVRRRGVKQFLTLYKRVEHIQKPELLWGDELEYHILSLSGDSRAPDRAVSLSLRAPELLDALIASEGSDPRRYDGCSWHAEYGRWMVEATPREPFGGYATELLRVERSMRLRRQRLLSMLRPDEIIPTIPSFPLMGVGAFTQPAASPCGPAAASSCVPDAVINPHPRMATLTQNIRERRGGNVEVRAPLFRDTATPEFAGEPLAHPEVLGDAMAYGMGSCCLQITFQARDVNESRFLTDQLAVLGPIMLALTAATPIFHGRLVDTDVRWDMICQSVDDRTPAERRGADEPVAAGAEQPDLAGGGVRRLGKSRYASISHYIYDCPIARKHGLACPVAQLNDLGCEVDEEMFQLLREGGVDDLLAQHMAFNFSRDPLVLFAERIDVDDEKETDHFENIQSTNWNSVRWKPPPSMDSPIGWRTEVRRRDAAAPRATRRRQTLPRGRQPASCMPLSAQPVRPGARRAASRARLGARQRAHAPRPAHPLCPRGGAAPSARASSARQRSR